MCTSDQCEKKVHAKGLCQSHYRQMQRRARGLKKPGPAPDPTAPKSRHNPSSTRWEAEMRVPKSAPLPRPTPRLDSGVCVRGHEVTPASVRFLDNGARVCLVCANENAHAYRARHGMLVGEKSHCGRGHAWNEENTLLRKSGSRMCRACSKHRTLVTTYGITLDQYNEILEEQGYSCRICGEALDLGRHTHLDHCHETGKVRGLLCGRCNILLGYAKDNLEILAKAAAYLND